MSQAEDEDIVIPDVSHLITEDDAPVDSIFQEKQMRLLVEPLYSSWRPTDALGRSRVFLAAADVGIFGSVHERAIVPDVMLGIDVAVPDEFWRKDKRSYYIWEHGKPPEVVIEIISNREGDELEGKRATYSKLRIAHYLAYDPLELYGGARLRVFELRGDLLVPASEPRFPRLNLGLTEWNGRFETKLATWLRWCDLDGVLIPTGEERAEQEKARAEQEKARAEQEKARAEQEKARAEQEKARAEQEKARAEQEKARAERLAAKLRELGVEPE